MVRKIILSRSGRSHLVPDTVYPGLGKPLLTTLQVRTEAGYDRHPWLYITFEIAPPQGSQVHGPRRVYLAWQNGRFVYRALKYKRPDGQWAFERTVLP
jgi:hypothetical protein